MTPIRLLSIKRLFASVTLAAGLAGCAALVTPVRPADLTTPVRLATTTEPELLRARAEQNEAPAQRALSLVLAYGLNGGRVDAAESAAWRTRSLQARASIPITQYTAAFNGQPSRVNMIYVPRYGVTAQSDQLVARCAAGLDSGDQRDDVCGNAATTSELRDLWTQARRRR